jgi:hypothetical protein
MTHDPATPAPTPEDVGAYERPLVQSIRLSDEAAEGLT